jgi:hypothetical protein
MKVTPRQSVCARASASLGMHGLGDIRFTDPTHHGEPVLRAAMFRSGYEAHKMDFGAAFDHAKGLSGSNSS